MEWKATVSPLLKVYLFSFWQIFIWSIAGNLQRWRVPDNLFYAWLSFSFFMQSTLKSNLGLAGYTSLSVLERRKYYFIFSLISTTCFETSDCSTFLLKAGQTLSSQALFWVMMSDYCCYSLLNFTEGIHIFFLGGSSKLGRMLQPRLFQFWTETGIISHILWAILTGSCRRFL